MIPSRIDHVVGFTALSVLCGERMAGQVCTYPSTHLCSVPSLITDCCFSTRSMWTRWQRRLWLWPVTLPPHTSQLSWWHTLHSELLMHGQCRQRNGQRPTTTMFPHWLCQELFRRWSWRPGWCSVLQRLHPFRNIRLLWMDCSPMCWICGHISHFHSQ